MATPLVNLEAAIAAKKVVYDSLHPIDKVVARGTIQVVNSGASTDPQLCLVVDKAITNPYGKQAFVRAVWSVDGVNYNSLYSHLLYTFTYNTAAPLPITTQTMYGLKGAVTVGISASTLTFRTGNGFHGTVSDNGTTKTYTPTSLTFTIKYAVYEVNQ